MWRRFVIGRPFDGAASADCKSAIQQNAILRYFSCAITPCHEICGLRPAKALPADRPEFQNVMPPFGPVYKDADLASLINYLRANFAPNAPKVTPEEIAAQRARL